MRSIAFLIAKQTLLLCACAALLFGSSEFTATVIGVVDGDTLDVLHENVSKRIRLSGIDCPEKKQAFGTRAKEFTANMVFGRTVTIRTTGHDRYRRILAEVILADGRVLNHELVRAGLAWWYQKYAPHDAELRTLETAARTAHRGLWSNAAPIPPWDFRRGRRHV